MKNIHKHILTGVLWLIAALPLFILYALSHVLAFFLFHILKYRRKVVETNMKRAFPEKSDAERRKIAKRFYLNLADIIHETIKFRHLSPRKLEKDVIIRNPEILQPFFDNKQSFLIVTGHNGNWEWICKRISIAYPDHGIVLTKPLKDKFFENYMTGTLRLRKISGLIIPYKDAFRHLIKNRRNFTYTMILGDQTPARGEINFWTTFLNQETPFFLGTEKIAKSLNMPVLFMRSYHPKQGLYEVEFEVITTEPQKTTEHEITLSHIQMLEDHIKNNPDTWLWSHKRWKHKMRSGEQLIN
jgi:KDO2-lipid IV(A) lauroyltransferase